VKIYRDVFDSIKPRMFLTLWLKLEYQQCDIPYQHLQVASKLRSAARDGLSAALTITLIYELRCRCTSILKEVEDLVSQLPKSKDYPELLTFALPKITIVVIRNPQRDLAYLSGLFSLMKTLESRSVAIEDAQEVFASHLNRRVRNVDCEVGDYVKRLMLAANEDRPMNKFFTKLQAPHSPFRILKIIFMAI
jgi:hypothetical protein